MFWHNRRNDQKYFRSIDKEPTLQKLRKIDSWNAHGVEGYVVDVEGDEQKQ